MLDCIDRPGLCGGTEELVQCFSLIFYVNENRLMEYLVTFDKQILYQKTGFVLGYFQEEMRLSDNFFAFCKSKVGKGTGYLSDEPHSDTYFKEWKLCAPENILAYLEQGGLAYV
jgi:predicted transcriptional regulator of viral defense system